jgi:hypothetical protein
LKGLLEPEHEPDDVEVDEPHRSRKARDDIRRAIVQTRGPLFSVGNEARVTQFSLCRFSKISLLV